MINPLTVLLGAVAAGGGYILYKEATKPKALDPSKLSLVDPKDPGKGVTALHKGIVYSITLTYDWTKIPNATIGVVPDAATHSPYIKGVLENLGFKVLQAPAPLGNASISLFLAGQPSTWVAMGEWTKDATGADPATMASLGQVFTKATIIPVPMAAPR